jgi:hypothetical protein
VLRPQKCFNSFDIGKGPQRIEAKAAIVAKNKAYEMIEEVLNQEPGVLVQEFCS